MKHSLVLTLGVSLMGCSVGPEYKPPEMAVPESWDHPVPGQNVASEKSSEDYSVAHRPLPENTQAWWDEFCDEDMKRLIARLIEVNPDLHRARGRIDEALAQRRTHSAAHWPHADFTGRTDRGLASFDNKARIRPTKKPRPKEDFWQIDAGWEIDLFGGHARKVEASDGHARATIEAWRDVLVFLIGEVGLYYTEMRVNEERVLLAEEFAAAYREVVRISAAKEERGAASRLELEEAEARLSRQEAEPPEYQRKAAQARNQLARLLACSSSKLRRYIGPSARVPSPPRNIYAGFPTDVLRARADIRAAEDRIEAQVARVGIATAQLYPKLKLSGAITYESIVSGGVTTLLRRSIGGGAGLTKRLFHAGADKARIAEEDALLKQSVREYEATVHRALTEVEDSLVDLHYGSQRKASLDAAVRSSKSASSRVREAYTSGLVDVGNLLRVVEEDLDIQTEQLFARNLLAKACVRLYKATGGGQLPLPPKETPVHLVATETPGMLRPLSVLFSLGTDDALTLHRRQFLASRSKVAKVPRDPLADLKFAPKAPHFPGSMEASRSKKAPYRYTRAYLPIAQKDH